MLDGLKLPEPWRGDRIAPLRLIDGISTEIAQLDSESCRKRRGTPTWRC